MACESREPRCHPVPQGMAGCGHTGAPAVEPWYSAAATPHPAAARRPLGASTGPVRRPAGTRRREGATTRGHERAMAPAAAAPMAGEPPASALPEAGTTRRPVDLASTNLPVKKRRAVRTVETRPLEAACYPSDTSSLDTSSLEIPCLGTPFLHMPLLNTSSLEASSVDTASFEYPSLTATSPDTSSHDSSFLAAGVGTEAHAGGRPRLPSDAAAPQGAPASSFTVFGMATGSMAERFTLGRKELGCGQFGSVRDCADVATGERLACKTVRKAAEKAEVQQEELRNEVAVMLRLTGHENVVQLRGVFEEPQEVHLVMDLCSGGELFDEVLRRQRFSEADAAQVFSEIVKAVAFCHARGVLHRDLKPENILLARPLPEGVPLAELAASGPLVKVADFGLAGLLAPGEKVKGMAGSPFYMAPEVLTGWYACKADVWSLGVILYILLSGSPPFWGDADDDVFKAILRNKPDLSAYPWNTVSPDAKSLIRCLLVEDPHVRPSAQKVLSHPWLTRHLSPSGAYAAPLPSQAHPQRCSVSVV